MTDQIPTTGASPVKVGLGRSNVVAVVALLAFLGAIVFFTGRGAFQMPNNESKVLNGGLAVLFAVPLVMLLRNLPRFLRPRYIVVDQVGLAIEAGKERVLVPWSELIAVGIGYQLPEAEKAKMPKSLDDVKAEVSGFLADRAEEALQVSGNRRLVLEIFPGPPDSATRYPRLKPFWKAMPPPYQGLPDWGWRFPLPPVTSIAQQIADGVHQRAPRHWLGWFARPWSGK
jgi:hypothetical protein